MKSVLLILVGVAIAAVLFFLFYYKKDSDSRELMKAKDELIESIRAERDAYIYANKELDGKIAELEKQDSVLNQKFIDNQKNYRANDKKMADIQSRIDRIADNDDSLRAILATYND